jgi:hypothetical protein
MVLFYSHLSKGSIQINLKNGIKNQRPFQRPKNFKGQKNVCNANGKMKDLLLFIVLRTK